MSICKLDLKENSGKIKLAVYTNNCYYVQLTV